VISRKEIKNAWTALRSRVRARYDTQKAFAAALGWHPNKVTKLLTGKYLPNVDEADDIASLLGFTADERISIFSRQISPKGDKSA
jgi:transcriptional regulator with XRE-family HTH domain